MSYTPTTWQKGDKVTAEKLNKIEQGIVDVSNKQEKFIVNLTATAEDFSGVMDKTVSEIHDAYLSGKNIWFKVTASGWEVNVPLLEVNYNVESGSTYPSFNTHVIYNTNPFVMIYMATGSTDDPDDNTYFTELFSFMPAQ